MITSGRGGNLVIDNMKRGSDDFLKRRVLMGIISMVFCLLFTNKLIILANDEILLSDYLIVNYSLYERNLQVITDFGNPQVNPYLVNASPKVAYERERINLSVYIEDDYYPSYDTYTSVYVHYKQPLSNNSTSIILNGQHSGYFSDELEVLQSMEAGKWQAEYVEIYRYSTDYYPGYDNSQYFYFYDNRYSGYEPSNGPKMDLSNLDFEIVGTRTDVEAPKVDLNSIEVKPKLVTEGETVNVSFALKDESQITGVELKYQSPITKKIKEIETTYNPEIDKYEFSLLVDETYESGVWEFYSLYVKDEYNNSEYISSYKLNCDKFNFEVYGTNADVTAPIVDLDSLEIDKKQVYPGETVRIKLTATDDSSGIESIGILYDDYSNNISWVWLVYDEEEGKYIGDLQISNGDYCYDPYIYSCNPAGKKLVRSIDVKDYQGNERTIYRSDHKQLTSLDFEVWDLEDPKVMASSISVDKDMAYPGDIVEVSIRALAPNPYDYRDEREVRVVYSQQNTYEVNFMDLEYDNSKGKFIGYFTIYDGMENGLWEVDSVSIKKQNSWDNTTIYNCNLSWNSECVDFNSGSFNVVGATPDYEAPEIDITSLNISHISGVSGDRVNISMKATDNISGITNFRVTYRTGESIYRKSIWLDETDHDIYSASIPLSEYSEIGLWQINDISVCDRRYNCAEIYDLRTGNQQYELVDLSAGDFVVLPTELKDYMIDSKGVIRKYSGTDETVVLPSQVGNLEISEIGDQVFKGNSHVKEVMIPSSILSIGEEAFFNMRNLTAVELSSDVQQIGQNAFLNTPSLEKITVNYSDEEIDSYDLFDWVSFIDESPKLSGTSAHLIKWGYVKNHEQTKLVRDLSSDWIAPTVSLIGEKYITLEAFTPYKELGVQATDNKDTDLTIEIDGQVDITKVGIYKLTYTVRDSANNSTQVERYVEVVDTQKPILTLNGDDVITIEFGSEYKELGATASDQVDGDLTSRIVVSGEVNTNKVGEYVLTYSVTDNNGNTAIITRHIIVTALFGDLNQDGFINSVDLSLIQPYYGIDNTSLDFNKAYDLNEDGIIDLYDIVLISNQIES